LIFVLKAYKPSLCLWKKRESSRTKQFMIRRCSSTKRSMYMRMAKSRKVRTPGSISWLQYNQTFPSVHTFRLLYSCQSALSLKNTIEGHFKMLCHRNFGPGDFGPGGPKSPILFRGDFGPTPVILVRGGLLRTKISDIVPWGFGSAGP